MANGGARHVPPARAGVVGSPARFGMVGSGHARHMPGTGRHGTCILLFFFKWPFIAVWGGFRKFFLPRVHNSYESSH